MIGELPAVAQISNFVQFINILDAFEGIFMKCSKCGKEINSLNHYYVPMKNRKEGLRYCINCAKEEHIVTLV
jgi:uncharacterized protein with PIN domain